MCDVGGAVKVGARVAWAGEAVVLAELRLVCAHGAADAAVGVGVVVVTGGAVHCGLMGEGAVRWERAGMGSRGSELLCPRGVWSGACWELQGLRPERPRVLVREENSEWSVSGAP